MEATMRIYWSHKSIPELVGLPPDERHRVGRAGFWKAHRHWQVWVVVASYGFLIPIGADMGALAGSQTIGMLVAAGVGGFLYSQVVTDYARPYFRSYAALYPDEAAERPHSD
jgi:hypothetical protein